ncbi:21 kDa protein-like [Silene latifolia]|uniref:21 kDa protein-like n=1 Tax=Silene latifolia TaxID=37657 RepID=UPI003D76E96B
MALSVTLDTAQTTSEAMSRMSRVPGMHPREAGAMRDCLEVLSDTVAELQSAMKEMGEMRGSKNFGLLMNDVQTWVSSALTDENTCMDGFGGKVIDGRIKTIIRGKIEIICHLTSNSLALINNFATIHG